MANYTGPKVKLSRRVGVPICDTPKHTARRQLNPPGVHGFRGRRLRDYGVRLNEKQKLRYYYNVMEKQFRRYLDESTRRKGNTGDIMLQALELRLDNVVRRLGWARTIWQARQMVVHGNILINGKKVDRPSYCLKPGDALSIREKNKDYVRGTMESLPGHEVPGWMTSDPSSLTGKILSLPTADQVPFDVNMNLIIEFYR